MQYRVPQFLDIEDKIIGGLTIKQFLYVLGAGGGGYLFYTFIPWKIIAIFPALTIVILGILLAFYKFNGKPFINLMQAAVNYITHDRLYVWHRREKKAVSEDVDLSGFKTTQHHAGVVPNAKTSKLENLTWQIDVSPTSGGDIPAQNVNPKIDI